MANIPASIVWSNQLCVVFALLVINWWIIKTFGLIVCILSIILSIAYFVVQFFNILLHDASK